MQTSLSTKADGAGSAWRPFQYTTFTVLWAATVLSNIGSWMQNAAAGWLMTSLSPEPFTVALVQAATTLPMFLFSLPAGALADIVDRRRVLIVVQIAAVAVAALFAIFVWLDWITPSWLLAFISVSGIATVLTMPAWQAIVPQLVPKEELRAAVALNGVGFNISRAIGPALAGLAIGALGMAAPYWINALSTFVVIAALIWWRRASIGRFCRFSYAHESRAARRHTAYSSAQSVRVPFVAHSHCRQRHGWVPIGSWREQQSGQHLHSPCSPSLMSLQPP
jgi:MFS family permease